MSRKIPPQLRRLVWEKYMPRSNEAYGPCYVCSATIHLLNFECGHVESHADGGSISVENLRPICGVCNKSMGTQNLYDYKKQYFSTSFSKKKKISVEELTLDMSQLKISHLPPVPTLRLDKPPILNGCEHMLTRGKRKGQPCNKKIYKDKYCSDHLSSHYSEWKDFKSQDE